MGDWVTWHTFIAFVLGVLLSGLVMQLVQMARSKVAG